jgi:hypothetical protein
MKAFIKNLELISIVFNNYEHIKQLETLSECFKQMRESDYSKEYPSDYDLTQTQIDRLFVICKTSQNSRYNYKLFTNPEFQNAENLITNVLLKHKLREEVIVKTK